MEGFKKISIDDKNPRIYVRYADCNDGDVLIDSGVFLGTEISTTFKNPLHIFRLPEGQEKCLNGAGQLNYQLEKHVTTGDTVKIIFRGKHMLTRGAHAGTESYQFETYVKGQTELKPEPAPAEQPSVVSKLVGAITGKAPAAKPAAAKPTTMKPVTRAKPQPTPADDGEDFAL